MERFEKIADDYCLAGLHCAIACMNLAQLPSSDAEMQKKGMEFFQKAADRGIADAIRRGFEYLKESDGTDERAIHWATQYADKGDLTAKALLALRYTRKRIDVAKALSYYRDLAKCGDEGAMECLSLTYRKGTLKGHPIPGWDKIDTQEEVKSWYGSLAQDHMLSNQVKQWAAKARGDLEAGDFTSAEAVKQAFPWYSLAIKAGDDNVFNDIDYYLRCEHPLQRTVWLQLFADQGDVKAMKKLAFYHWSRRHDAKDLKWKQMKQRSGT